MQELRLPAEDCDCDDRASNPDEFCSRGERCKLCRCLAGDCDCDETAPNPDSFCLSGEKCKVALKIFCFA